MRVQLCRTETTLQLVLQVQENAGATYSAIAAERKNAFFTAEPKTEFP